MMVTVDLPLARSLLPHFGRGNCDVNLRTSPFACNGGVPFGCLYQCQCDSSLHLFQEACWGGQIRQGNGNADYANDDNKD